MKVLQLNKAYPPHLGGVETVVQQIADALHTDVLCCNDSAASEVLTEPTHTIYKASTLLRLFSTPISLHFIWLLHRIHRRYDLIHVHHPDPMSALALFLIRPKTRIVLHWHSDILRQQRLLKLYRPLQQWLIDRADAIVATTPSYIDGSPFLSAVREKCVVIPIGIPPPRADESVVAAIRNRFEEKTVIFSLGRFVYYKGFEYLIDAAKELSDAYVIVIGGDGPLKEALQHRIRQNGLEERVVLTGKIPDDAIGSYFAACDLFCLSSIERTEAFGIVQIEAMSLGKPVVATRIEGSGVAWVNRHGESGLNVPVKDAKALAGAIKEIAENSKLYGEMSHNAYLRYSTHFTLERMVENVRNLYASVIRKGHA